MEHKLLRNIAEYRIWAWGIYQYWLNHKNNQYVRASLNVANAIGIEPIFECWDSFQNKNGEWIDINEDGSVIPEDTAENVKLSEWMNEVSFPAVAVYVFENFEDRLGKFEGYLCDFVSLNEFGL